MTRSYLSKLLPLLVLVGGFVATYFLQQAAFNYSRQTQQDYFNYQPREIVLHIEQRLAAYEQALLGSKRLFVASKSVKRDEFRDYADAIRHLISAHFRALDHLNRNPQDAAYRMATHLGLPAANVLTAFKGLLLPDATDNRRMLTGSPPQLTDTARKVSAIMVEENFLPRDDPLTTLIRADFLPTHAL